MPRRTRSLPELPCCLCLHDDHWFVEAAIRSFLSAGPATAFVSRVAWDGTAGPWERCAEAAERAGAEIVIGDWADEASQRRFVLEEMSRRGHTYFLIPDGDEVISRDLLTSLQKIAEVELADLVRVRLETYWKDGSHVIRPPEEFAPTLLLDCRTVQHHHLRDYRSARPLLLGREHGVLHHLSYAGPDERIRRKVATWSHRHEVDKEWYRRVWLGWDRDPLMRDLHPTHPPSYGFAERIELPGELKDVAFERQESEDPVPPANWPAVDIVIPLYGGEADIRHCLQSLEASRGLLAEVVVVDDVSPDGASKVVEEFPWVRLVRNEANLGFAGTCNRGYGETTSEAVIFLNSDTRVPRAGLVRLIESLWSSGTVAAAGPLTNEAGYFQAVQPTYTDVSRLDLCARDFASREADDEDVPMLVGFCLACRRSVLDELGEPPFDERFKNGTFEDTDLCHRLLRRGYRLRLSARAYVHHEGSNSLRRLDISPGALLNRNQQLYEDKWKGDLESGFADRLTGLSAAPVTFNPARSPEKVRKHLAWLAKQADISLCMIVRNEERVLGACLDSVTGAFTQTIVVDTGSTDRTVEIAREHGAEIYEMVWPDSFSAARNESLKYAKGRWVFWLDADDTMALSSVEAILEAAVNAAEDVSAFVIPVQFVEGGEAVGTRVDHVKLFRNLSGVSFEGRIHEQVLSSLRAVMPEGRIERVPGAVVLHSGYDTSPEGQARKAVRDEGLLALDLADRPNHPFVLFNLGMTSHYRSGHPEAVDWLRKSIAAAQPGESHIRKAYALMAVSLRESEGPEAALAAIDEGLNAVGPDPELLFHRGLVLSRLERYAEARGAYLAMPLDASQWFTSLDTGILGAKRSHNLGSVCAVLGHYGEARDWFRKALAESPHFGPSAAELFNAAMAHEDLKTAREAHEALLKAEGATEGWVSMGMALAHASGQEPSSFLSETVRRHPAAIGPKLVLARKLLEAGDERAAEPLLRKMESVGVAEAAFFRGIQCTRRGDYGRALMHMNRAQALDPHHAQTTEQIVALTEALAAAPPPGANAEVLAGPHRGALSEATKRHSVVIVTFNSARTLETCLWAVLTELGEEDELIVVDNASSDDTVATLNRLTARTGNIQLIRQDSNSGYSCAANLGILASTGRYVTLLNPDTEPAPGWLQGLASRIDSGYAAVGPVSDRVSEAQFVARFLESDERPPVGALTDHLAATVAGLTVPTHLLMGLCLMADRQVLVDHGLLDEGTELGADDLELSWRLRALGYRLAVAADVFVRHDQGVSFASLPEGERSDRSSRSDEALAWKLEAYYGQGAVPSSREIWGTDIFASRISA